MKLIYYRGDDECRASEWHDDPSVLAAAMRWLSCETGYTQIGRLLTNAFAEKDAIAAVVFVGDHCEENREELVASAQRFGGHSVPLFIFHECADHDHRSIGAKPTFKKMAEVSGGVYCEFKPDSGAILRELLASVAAFATRGAEGVKRALAPKNH